MKKKLESELNSIAHRILKLSGKEDVDKLHSEVAELYEKLTVLKFAKDNFEDEMPTIGSDTSFFDMLDVAFNNKISDTVEVDDKVFINVDDVEDDGIMEHVTEKIKDIVAHMPEDEDDNEDVKTPDDNSLEALTLGFEELPIFEPKTTSNTTTDKPKSLNEKLKSNTLNIGLNDKLAFIKHLFENSSEDYERVLSQINTSESFDEASGLIQNIIKPDYNHWEGKEEFEKRFMQIIKSKYN